MSVLRERTIWPVEKGRRGGGSGPTDPRIDDRNCGCECTDLVRSSPVQFTLQMKQSHTFYFEVKTIEVGG